jgi:hypothetical protein
MSFLLLILCPASGVAPIILLACEQELEKARILIGQVIRREKLKRDRVEALRAEFDVAASPLAVRTCGLDRYLYKIALAYRAYIQPFLQQAVDTIARKDADKIFHRPVPIELVPTQMRVMSV